MSLIGKGLRALTAGVFLSGVTPVSAEPVVSGLPEGFVLKGQTEIPEDPTRCIGGLMGNAMIVAAGSMGMGLPDPGALQKIEEIDGKKVSLASCLAPKM